MSVAAGEIPEWAKQALTLLLGSGIGGGFFALLGKRSNSPADLVKAGALLQAELGKQANEMLEDLRGEVEVLRTEIAAMKIAHAVEMAAAETRHKACENESLQLLQQYESLCGYLRRAGIDVPTRRDARPFVVLHDGQAEPSIINMEPGGLNHD